MNIDGTSYRTIWVDTQQRLNVINQQLLPHHFEIVELDSLEAVCAAIRDMTVRGAGLIGAAAGYGMWLAACSAAGQSVAAFEKSLAEAAVALRATRPTAGNLAWAVERQLEAIRREPDVAGKIECARQTAQAIADEDAAFGQRIGEHGKTVIQELAFRKKDGEPVNILTHCNAGWLAFVDYGSALSPIYAAHDAGIPVHVWVDETRPRNQGASLTAWELSRHGVPHSLIADNAGGHLMQHGLVDMVITGADRVTRQGDAANKIGTYLKALAAKDNAIPFYVALPSSTFDFSMRDGLVEIPIEERDPDEVRVMTGKCLCPHTSEAGIGRIQICPDETPARNWAFDVTPARLITGLICERGLCMATETAILQLFPEQEPTA